MPRIVSPLEGGYDLQLDEYAAAKNRIVCNLLVDGPQIRSRPGLKAFATAAPSVTAIAGILGTGFSGTSHPQIIGLFEYLDRLVAIDGNRRAYTFTQAGVCQDGTSSALPGSDPPRFLVDHDGRLLIFGGGAPRVMGPDFIMRPFFRDGSVVPQATHGVLVDRILILNDRGTNQWFYAFIDDHTFIDADQFLKAGVRADAVLGLAELNNNLYIFTRDSVEFWYGTGNTNGDIDPFRLERALPGEYGIGPAQSLLKAADTLWWMDRQRRIVRLEGNQPKIVSLPIERQIETFESVDDCVAQYLEIAGKHLVSFTFQAARTTCLVDAQTGDWTEWRRWDGAAWTAMPLQAFARQRAWNRSFCGAARTAGDVLELDRAIATDEGVAMRCVHRGPNVDGGVLKTKFVHYAQIVMERGKVTDSTLEPNVEVRWRDEGGAWWTPRPMSQGRVGEQGCVFVTRMMGSYTKRQRELNITTGVPFSMSRWEEDVTIGVA